MMQMSAAGQILRNACADGTYSLRKGIYLRAGTAEFPFPPENLLDGSRILKNSRSVISGFDPERRYFIKKYRKNGLMRTLKRALLQPRSYRCLAAALRLHSIHLPTPAVLLASRYCLITEVLSGVQYLTECPECAREAVSLLVKLHDSGIRHGDFNLRNIYRNPDGSLGVIDLDGSRLYAGAVPEKVRFLELARLISSYLKSVPCQPEAVPRITADFSADYDRMTRFDFYGPKLLARVIDLAARR